MRFRLGEPKETEQTVKLCFKDENLLNEYLRKKKTIDIVQMVLSVVWLAVVFVFVLLFPEEETEFLFTLPMLCLIGSILLSIFIVQCVWNVQKGKIFNESERRLPYNEDGNLRRMLIKNLRLYYKIFTPVVCIGFLIVIVCAFFISEFFADKPWVDIVMIALSLLPVVPTVILSFKFSRERAAIVQAIENQPKNLYDNSDLYKNQ